MQMVDRFHRWMEKHDRTYATADEKLRRFEVYRRNVEHIEATNREGKLSYTLGENLFTDLTSDEFMATFTDKVVVPEVADDDDVDEMLITTRAGDVAVGRNARHVNASAVPESIDWRELGAVTPVKFQGLNCGSCYAFAVVAAVEGLHKIKTGELVSLSEQQLVECAGYGCSSGYISRTYAWISNNGGITTEADYPNTGVQGTCDKGKLAHHAATIRGWLPVVRNNEVKLMEAVARQPITVAIESSTALQHYNTGVFSGPCGYNVNHAVTIVGYGKDAVTSKKYWIAKNSYSQKWGMGGYILMERDFTEDRRGLCSLASNPEYPIM